MKTKTILINVLLIAFFTIILGAFARVVSADSHQMPVYRLYNPNTGEYFYTLDENERLSLESVGWNDEGIGWFAPESGAPVYRIYNPNSKGGDHYYTMSKYEADQNVKKGWKWDNNGAPAFYSGGNTAVYVAYNPNAESGSHNYTTNVSEQANLLNVGWKYGATAWQAVALGQGPSHKDELGYQILTQQDPRWSQVQYGSETIGESGCGLVATVMAANALLNKNLTPLDVVNWANETNNIAYNDDRAVLAIAQHLGLTGNFLFKTDKEGTATQANINQINQVLQNGGMVIISGTSKPSYALFSDGQPSPFSYAGHFIVIKKLTTDGKWMIFDSNYKTNPTGISPNNNRMYTPSDIMSQQYFYAVAVYR